MVNKMKKNMMIVIGLLILTGCSIPSTSTPIPTLPVVQTESITPIPSKVAQLPLATETQTPVPQPTLQKKNFETINLQNAPRLNEVATISLENPGRIFWLPDRNSMLVIGYRKFYIIDLAKLSIKKEIDIAENESLLDFSPATTLLAFTTDRNSVTIKDMDGKIIQTITQKGGFGSAAFSPTGDALWLSSMEKFETGMYDIQTGKLTSSCGGFETAAPVYSAFPSPQGKWLVWIARATIQLNKIPSCQPGAHIGHEDFIISHTFSSDEQTLITSTGGTLNNVFQPLVFFWDAQTGKQTGVIPLKESPAAGLALSPNDEILVTAGNGLILWDPATKTEIKQLGPTGNRFNATSFSPDGSMLAATDESMIHLYVVQP
jgi:WD40 repeat protein